MYDVIITGARVAGAPTAMLLARRGYKVLLVDRATFPSDTLSTHYIHQPGVAALKRWGVLDKVAASGCPAITEITMDLGPFSLTGWGPDSEGVLEAYSPRRTVLDKILVDAAAEAGAEVQEGFSVQELVWDGDRVTGIRGRTAAGAHVTANARIVVGADGMRSFVAKQVKAPTYNERPAQACYYYSYFSGMPEITTMYPREGRVSVHFPTNDGLSVVVVGWPNAEFQRVRGDIEGNFYSSLDEISSALGEMVRAGRREERWTGTADIPNFFRKPYGPGWALVGDAGYHKDPVTGYGITDSFRDAGYLADALDAGLGGAAPMEEALADYEHRRNEFAMPMYEFILGLASMEAPTPEMQQLFFALQGNDEGIRDLFGVIDGTVPMQQFFSEENLGRIMARAQQAA
jgi:2-polyprenyl-6-methoxyphenol hydroxylase-like FAD-dependent oxidoreductase